MFAMSVPRPASGGNGKLLAWILIPLFVIAVAGAATFVVLTRSNHSAANGGTGGQASTTAPNTSQTVLSTAQVQQIAQGIGLSAQDLHSFSSHPALQLVPGAVSNGWVPLQQQGVPPAASGTPLASGNGCLTQNAATLGGFGYEYSYDLNPNGEEEGHGITDVRVDSTAAGAQADQAQIMSSSYQSCFITQDVQANVSSGGAKPAGSTTSTVETISTGVPTIVIQYTTPYTFVGQKTEYETVAWMQYQQYRAIVDLWTCCGSTPTSDVASELALVAQRMKSAPAKITAG